MIKQKKIKKDNNDKGNDNNNDTQPTTHNDNDNWVLREGPQQAEVLVALHVQR
jgi:hypothetical protein